MKHLPIVLVLLGLLYVCFSPQLQGQPSVKLGLQGGLNFANSSTAPSVSTSARTGLAVGALIEVGITQVLFLQPELLYIQKGAKFSVSNASGSGTVVWKLDYIELPLLLKAKFGTSDFKPIIFAGPNLGLNLSAEVEGTTGNQTQSVDIKNSVQTVDPALDFGVGGELQIDPRSSFSLSIRYSLGLSDIDKSTTGSWKSNGIQILLGASAAL